MTSDSSLLGALGAHSGTLLAGDGTTISARELLEVTERLAAALGSVGRAERARVGVVMANGPSLAATCLAAMAVATCAPLDPRSRPDELRRAYVRLGLDVVIVDDLAGDAASLAARAGLGVLAPAVRGRAPELVRPPSRRLGPRHGDDAELALVLSSSGTTAEPKLIGLTEDNLMSSARAVASTLQLEPGDRCLNVMPLFHIHGLVGALLSSLVGGAAVDCTAGFDAFSFRRRLADPTITWSTAVPSMYQAVLMRRREGAPPDIRLLRSSSAPLQAAAWQALEDAFECPVLQAYGMTEAAHQMASNPVPPGERRIGTVGPGAGADVALLVDGSVVVDHGVDGEVVVRGPGVMPGYLAPPGADDAAFVDGWFRTGDLGRLDPDGYLTLVGRLKEIINVGGETVSPFEIEAVVLDHPRVLDAAAFAIDDPLRGEVAGLVVVADDVGVAPEEIRRFAAERLSRAKVPARVVVVDTIPLGPTGKVQRSRLPAQLALVRPT